MLSRVVSGILMAVGIIAVLVLTPWWGFGLVVAFALTVGAVEYQKMARPDVPAVEVSLFVLACLVAGSSPLLQSLWSFWDHGVALTVAFFILAIARLIDPGEIETSLRRLSADVLGLIYLGVTFPLILLLRQEENGGYLVLLCMVITFGSDTGAYFSGRLLGRHKLYPAVSPNKTIEGAVGGMCLAIGFAFIGRAYFPGLDGLSTFDCLILGGFGATFAIIGDLIESLMKRSYGVKDSGTLIPGHGGILDRIDGLLFCGPFVWLYLETTYL